MVNPSTYEGLGLLELRCGLVHDIIRHTKMSSQNLPNTHFQPWSTSGPPKNEIEYACGIYIYIFRIIYVIPFEGTTVTVTNFARTKKPSFRREIFFVTNKNMVSLKVSSRHRNFHAGNLCISFAFSLWGLIVCLQVGYLIMFPCLFLCWKFHGRWAVGLGEWFFEKILSDGFIRLGMAGTFPR